MRDESGFEETTRHWGVIAVVASLMEMSRPERPANPEMDRQVLADAARLIVEETQAVRQCLERMRESVREN